MKMITKNVENTKICRWNLKGDILSFIKIKMIINPTIRLYVIRPYHKANTNKKNAKKNFNKKCRLRKVSQN